MKAKSLKAISPSEFKTEQGTCMSDGYKPTLAIVFMSFKQDRSAISEILRKKDIDLFGATSCGEFTDGHQSDRASPYCC